MRTLLLALLLTLTIGATTNAQTLRVEREQNPLIQMYNDMKTQEAVVEQHPQAGQPIDMATLAGPLPPYLAQKHLRGEQFIHWAMTWNAYHDELAKRESKQRVLYGSTTTITRTTNGTVSSTVPRFWTFQQGTPGVIRYNPFVTPQRN